ncbi:MAG: hypothetical protein KME30_22725 [Iphinoe sp. HA4291-MV1]|jgi:small-conductance mechanosensitive channel|nr:hypothetical protein [Iphinoe sp. HA4291-MV1]
MEIKEILQILPKLTASERLVIAEAALKLNRQERTSLSIDQQKQQLAAARTPITDFEGEDFDYTDDDQDNLDTHV